MGNTSSQIATEKYKPKNSQFPIRIKNPIPVCPIKNVGEPCEPGRGACKSRKKNKKTRNQLVIFFG
jgi:hypothetical protein